MSDDIVGILNRYEIRVTPFRTKAKSENEIIVDEWTNICKDLERHAILDNCGSQRRRDMRLAAREIRAALRKENVGNYALERLKGSERECYSVASAHLELMTIEHDILLRNYSAGHPLKRRIGAVVQRLRHAIGVMGRNIEPMKPKV